MMNDFKGRTYYRLVMTLTSPLSVGSGNNENTDHDIVIDAMGRPFIPAATIAGVLRSYFSMEQGNSIFGYVKTKKEEKAEEIPSSVSVYDAYPLTDNKNLFITIRDSVKLCEKVAVKGAKFDQEAVETGAVFVSYLELLDNKYENPIEEALAALNSGQLRFGTKTTRGYGQVSLKVFKKHVHTFDDYLSFDMMDEWKDPETLELKIRSAYPCLKLSLECAGGISIREYSTDVDMPDYRQLALHDKNSTPVIPGTSWAGAFRERYETFAGTDAAKKLFGVVDEKNNEVRKSKVIFSETRLSNGVDKIITRNSVDRFSANTRALYTEKTYYNGKGDLIISFSDMPDDNEINVIAACIADLDNGLLAVGGLTAVGRGLFRVKSVNDTSVGDSDIIYEMVKEALR